MRTRASRCEAPRDRKRAPVPRWRPGRSGAGSHRSTCCREPAPLLEPTRSDTRTTGSRGAPDIGHRHRHRSLRRMAPAGRASASWDRLALVGNEPAVRHVISLTAPAYRRSKESGTVGGERDQILERDEPKRLARESERAFDRKAKYAAAHEHAHEQGNDVGAEQRGDQRKWKRMCDD